MSCGTPRKGYVCSNPNCPNPTYLIDSDEVGPDIDGYILLILIIFAVSIYGYIKLKKPSRKTDTVDIRALSCAQLRQQYINKHHRSHNHLSIVGCEGRQYIGILRPNEGFVIRRFGGIFVNNTIHSGVIYTFNDDFHYNATFDKNGTALIHNKTTQTVRVSIARDLDWGSNPSIKRDFIRQGKLIYILIDLRCKYFSKPPMSCLLL